MQIRSEGCEACAGVGVYPAIPKTRPKASENAKTFFMALTSFLIFIFLLYFDCYEQKLFSITKIFKNNGPLARASSSCTLPL